ncbi:MAG: chromosomal replication initiator protein DnaA [Alphaproteobacteria bacterium]|nr:chromosomal replication initiator protein DnaA [Alphaproteobacteria bacterium]
MACSTTDADALSAAWERIWAGLRRDLGGKVFDQWLRFARLGEYCEQSRTLEILLPSDFATNFVAGNFQDRLRLAWRSVNVGVDDVRIVRASDTASLQAYAPLAIEMAAAPVSADQVASLRTFQPRHSFETFVVAESNRLAFHAAQAMGAPDRPRFNPLFVHGATGQGKTHLLHAIAGAYAAAHPGATIIYMSAEKFMYEFVTAMRANDTMAFKARLRGAELLLIDDIQFISGKGSTQEEFLHTINEIVEGGARLAISADRAPHMLDAIDPRILSRLAGGLVADIQAAGLGLRLDILERMRITAKDTQVPVAVIEFLAHNVRTNIRELEGAFNKLVAYASLTGRQIDLEFAQTMLADFVRANARRITIDEIQKLTAKHFKIDQSEMRSKRRSRAVARPRQIAMYLAKKMTPRSLPEIGRIFGGRDHSTVIHAVRTIEALRAHDANIDADIRALQRQLEA